MSSLQIKEETNDKLEIHNTANNLDKQLAPDIPTPLPNYSGFNFVICGPSGSGKTTALYSMMTKRKKNGVRQSYRKVFDKIYIVSPTMANNSMKSDPFKDIPKKQVYRSITLDHLEELEGEIQSNREDGINSVIILDDVGSQLRKSAAIEKKLTQMVQNRRHDFTSYFFLIQKFKDLQTGIRNNMSHFLFYKPKTMPEREAIANELFPFKKNKFDELFTYVFENKDNYSFMFVDMSLKNTNKFIFHNKFNALEIKDNETGITN
tara:strand:- start:790 stop:1578 length:789 start_codon:yes stop_codon:yes gene_type:complete